MKLWGGRFNKSTNKVLEEFTESVSFDKRLYKYDIQGSIAHIEMLCKQNIVSKNDKNVIIKNLKKIETEIDNNEFEFDISLEDIHMHIEKRLIDLCGLEIGGKLHTARSRNDQVAVDVKLYIKNMYKQLEKLLKDFLTVLVDNSEKNLDYVMPGFTHLQHAQPVYVSHYLLAYFEKFKRDFMKCHDLKKYVNECPLGAGALAGTTHNIDRKYTADKLGFVKPTDNSIDSVSDRDFILDFLYISSLIMLHLSGMSEEFIIWSSQEYGYIEIDDRFTTGSSIMPNKKNPDICELTRGKTAKIISNLNSVMILVKALPLSYNRDLQEDKKVLFDTADTVLISLKIYTEMLKNIKFNRNILEQSLEKGFIEATDIADYLVEQSVPFRTAHKISGEIVKYCIDNNKVIKELSLDEFEKFDTNFDDKIFDKIKIKNIVDNRKSYGGTSIENVKQQIKSAKKFLTIL